TLARTGRLTWGRPRVRRDLANVWLWSRFGDLATITTPSRRLAGMGALPRKRRWVTGCLHRPGHPLRPALRAVRRPRPAAARRSRPGRAGRNPRRVPRVR